MAKRKHSTVHVKASRRKRPYRGKMASVAVRTRFLIISEDTKSSRYYFEEIAASSLPGYVAVHVQGVGKSTLSLVEDVARIQSVELAKLRDEGVVDPKFNQIWVLFDKDDFKNDAFDNAIKKANSIKDCRAAWSNECFEYWNLLHFNNCGSALGRGDVYRKLEECYPDFKKKFGGVSYESLKGDSGRMFHQEMAHSTNRHLAIKRAKRQNTAWKPSDAPHARNPSTYVCDLMEALFSSASYVG